LGDLRCRRERGSGWDFGVAEACRPMAGVNLDRGFGNDAESEFQPADSIVKPAVCNSWAQRLQVVEKAGEIWVASGVTLKR
jgi:hypothetical protein